MKNRFNKFAMTNPWLKLASLALATVLWFFIVSKGRSVIIMDVPIGFKNIPSELEIVEWPKTIGITIEGQERLLKKLRREDINVVVDLSKVKKGRAVFLLTNDNISLPKTLTVTEISPQTVKLVIEGKAKKLVPVRPIIVGSPADGFSVKNVEVVPKMVEIWGPESVVTKIYSVKTEPIDITEIISTSRYSVYLDIGKRNINVDTPEVEVNIIVQKK